MRTRLVALVAVFGIFACAPEEQARPITGATPVALVADIPDGFRQVPLRPIMSIGNHYTFQGRGPRVGCFFIGTSENTVMVDAVTPGVGRCQGRFAGYGIVPLQAVYEKRDASGRVEEVILVFGGRMYRLDANLRLIP